MEPVSPLDTTREIPRRSLLEFVARPILATGAAAALPALPAPAAPAGGADDGRVLRLGLISAASYGRPGRPRASGSNHGTAFATACNGFDPEKRARCAGTFVASAKRIEGVRVVKIWDPLREAAENLAAACDIPQVCGSPEECSEGVDAVAIPDDGSGEQWKLAITPLRRGVPTFCDKPLAMTAKEAKEIASIARQAGTPLMSASALRFVPDVVALAGEVESLGRVHLASTICGNELVYYGIHALEMAYAVLGGGAVSCLNVGQPGRNIVRVRFKDERDLLLLVAEKEWMQAGYQLNLFGTKGWRTLKPDLTNLYWYLLERFVHLARTGEESVPIEEEVEVIAVLEAGKRSLQEQREVTIEEVLR